MLSNKNRLPLHNIILDSLHPGTQTNVSGEKTSADNDVLAATTAWERDTFWQANEARFRDIVRLFCKKIV